MGLGKPKMPSAPPAPPPAPDLADEVLRDAGATERRRQLGGQRASFLTGVLDDQSQAATSTTKLIGS